MLELFGDIGGSLFGAFKAVAPALGAGLVVKHAGKITDWIPNDAIPLIQIVGGAAVGALSTGDPAQGAAMGVAAGSGAVGLHQFAKTVIRSVTERVFPTPGKVQNAIGPGERISI
jgi:hypothetical protein